MQVGNPSNSNFRPSPQKPYVLLRVACASTNAHGTIQLAFAARNQKSARNAGESLKTYCLGCCRTLSHDNNKLQQQQWLPFEVPSSRIRCCESPSSSQMAVKVYDVRLALGFR